MVKVCKTFSYNFSAHLSIMQNLLILLLLLLLGQNIHPFSDLIANETDFFSLFFLPPHPFYYLVKNVIWAKMDRKNLQRK
jgi:hypothetical protein